MLLKEKIDKLITNNSNITGYKDLLIKIFKQLEFTDCYQKAEREKSNFSKMLNGERPLNKDFYIPLEKIFGIRIADLLDEETTVSPKYYEKGLRYTVASNNYNKFVELSQELSEENNEIIFNTDEYNKGIFDYIVEYQSNEGIKFLTDKYSLQYNCFSYAIRSPINHGIFCYGDNVYKIANLLFKFDDGDTFARIFNTYNLTKNIFYNQDKLIYNNQDFLKKILESNSIFNSLIKNKELSLTEVNTHLVKKQDEKGIFINPILNILLKLAFEDPKKYDEKINQILEYAIKNNLMVIKRVEELEFYDRDQFKINEIGSIVLGHTVYGNLINIDDNYINPEISPTIRNKIEKINEINNCLLLHEIKNPITNLKRIQKNKEGNIIKLHTNNEIEYEMFSNIKDTSLPISKFLGTKDNIDEFSAYIGQNDSFEFNKEELKEVSLFIRSFHEESQKFLNNKVYVHNQLNKENLYFTQNKLTCVSNWDECHIGEFYEDIIYVILNHSKVNMPYRNDDEVLDNIFLILDTYSNNNNKKKTIINNIKPTLNKKINELDLKMTENIKEYEILKWIEIFFDIYSNKLLENYK